MLLPRSLFHQLLCCGQPPLNEEIATAASLSSDLSNKQLPAAAAAEGAKTFGKQGDAEDKSLWHRDQQQQQQQGQGPKEGWQEQQQQQRPGSFSTSSHAPFVGQAVKVFAATSSPAHTPSGQGSSGSRGRGDTPMLGVLQPAGLAAAAAASGGGGHMVARHVGGRGVWEERQYPASQQQQQQQHKERQQEQAHKQEQQQNDPTLGTAAAPRAAGGFEPTKPSQCDHSGEGLHSHTKGPPLSKASSPAPAAALTAGQASQPLQPSSPAAEPAPSRPVRQVSPFQKAIQAAAAAAAGGSGGGGGSSLTPTPTSGAAADVVPSWGVPFTSAAAAAVSPGAGPFQQQQQQQQQLPLQLVDHLGCSSSAIATAAGSIINISGMQYNPVNAGSSSSAVPPRHAHGSSNTTGPTKGSEATATAAAAYPPPPAHPAAAAGGGGSGNGWLVDGNLTYSKLTRSISINSNSCNKLGVVQASQHDIFQVLETSAAQGISRSSSILQPMASAPPLGSSNVTSSSRRVTFTTADDASVASVDSTSHKRGVGLGFAGRVLGVNRTLTVGSSGSELIGANSLPSVLSFKQKRSKSYHEGMVGVARGGGRGALPPAGSSSSTIAIQQQHHQQQQGEQQGSQELLGGFPSNSIGSNSSSITTAPVPSRFHRNGSSVSLGSGRHPLSSSPSTGSLLVLAHSRSHSSTLGSSWHSGTNPSVTDHSSSTSTTSSGQHHGLTHAHSSNSLSSSGSSGIATAATATASASGSPAAAVLNSEAVAAKFADAFLKAMEAGDLKWASEISLASLFDEQAKMVAPDKQVFVGKTAILRRLNQGIEQLVKMASSYVEDGGETAGGAAAAGGDGNGGTSSGSKLSQGLGSKKPKAALEVSCPDRKGRPSYVIATYTFKWGLRKFVFKDEFVVRGGLILRLRRSRS